MMTPSNPFFLLTVTALINHIPQISADCECGYRVGSSSSQSATLLFTDTILTDFRELSSLSETPDWKIKQLRLDYTPGTDRLGRVVEDRNVILNPVLDSSNLNSPSAQGPGVNAGLQLIVRSTLVEGELVSTGQIQSTREDIRFGSFRAYMKSSPVNGTCAASFWYYNDTQEIDMELLSREQIRSQNPINLSIHSEESADDASNTTGTIERQLDFNPAQNFHEYRYDWSQEAVSYYVDGKWLGDIKDFIPTTPGYVELSHWSDGFQGWSGGPPSQDALMTVAYFVGYFNSTDSSRVQEFEERCADGRGASHVCDVSHMKGIPSVASEGFSLLMKEKSDAMKYCGKHTMCLVTLCILVVGILRLW
ncbi:hypothetical protein E8E13_004986 [Curvularia kusanoi]|uniref:GH16 domain-containing protein n=1 Tax=Curvularia kusanoi TaxID=90978 RepID=A0A9P4T7G5_CURKU|nr:hypothetical protein E8E13_004986 [Curvularia kusanoi]